jgi:hypothetical protein
MELLFTSKSTVTEAEYRFQLETGEVVFYKEWLNEEGKVIDCTLRTKSGYEISDPILMEQIQDKVDEMERNG